MLFEFVSEGFGTEVVADEIAADVNFAAGRWSPAKMRKEADDRFQVAERPSESMGQLDQRRVREIGFPLLHFQQFSGHRLLNGIDSRHARSVASVRRGRRKGHGASLELKTAGGAWIRRGSLQLRTLSRT